MPSKKSPKINLSAFPRSIVTSKKNFKLPSISSVKPRGIQKGGVIKLVVGLGNPEEKYNNTRHNAGREIVLVLVDDLGAESTINQVEKNYLVSQAKSLGLTIMAPQTYMNDSGKAVSAFLKNSKIKPAQILVIHDDIDLPLGKAKISFAKNSAGHKGVESIIKVLKTNEFWRLRIGISLGKKKIDALKIVLKKWQPEELKIFKKLVKKSVETIKIAAMEGPEKAMSEFNS
ncbi:MAG: aminoacyl-tRNA hydrolase, partial [Candidatus Staskawiczbacteria bacterium]|nr:aminoacyl-tRNA hydrolase [Candidatus Staskawiczbacteria bacterium]